MSLSPRYPIKRRARGKSNWKWKLGERERLAENKIAAFLLSLEMTRREKLIVNTNYQSFKPRFRVEFRRLNSGRDFISAERR